MLITDEHETQTNKTRNNEIVYNRQFEEMGAKLVPDL